MKVEGTQGFIGRRLLEGDFDLPKLTTQPTGLGLDAGASLGGPRPYAQHMVPSLKGEPPGPGRSKLFLASGAYPAHLQGVTPLELPNTLKLGEVVKAVEQTLEQDAVIRALRAAPSQQPSRYSLENSTKVTAALVPFYKERADPDLWDYLFHPEDVKIEKHLNAWVLTGDGSSLKERFAMRDVYREALERLTLELDHEGLSALLNHVANASNISVAASVDHESALQLTESIVNAARNSSAYQALQVLGSYAKPITLGTFQADDSSAVNPTRVRIHQDGLEVLIDERLVRNPKSPEAMAAATRLVMHAEAAATGAAPQLNGAQIDQHYSDTQRHYILGALPTDIRFANMDPAATLVPLINRLYNAAQESQLKLKLSEGIENMGGPRDMSDEVAVERDMLQSVLNEIEQEKMRVYTLPLFRQYLEAQQAPLR